MVVIKSKTAGKWQVRGEKGNIYPKKYDTRKAAATRVRQLGMFNPYCFTHRYSIYFNFSSRCMVMSYWAGQGIITGPVNFGRPSSRARFQLSW